MTSIPKNVKLGTLSGRAAPTAALAGVVLLATWMGYAYGGYFATEWAPATLLLAVLGFILALAGVLRGIGGGWSGAALGLFAGYAAWTFASILWSPNRGDAWVGAGQTLLYVMMFGLTLAFLALGASRRWVLAASVLGPAALAAYTLRNLSVDPGALFESDRLAGTVGYYNGQAAFLLVPFWVAIYLAGSRRLHPLLRGLVLAGATLNIEVAALAQSRGALVAMALSLPVFFLLSGQRVRGLLALTPVAAALFFSFPRLNAVYLASLDGGSVPAAIQAAAPIAWICAAGAGLYALLWAVVDRLWEPPTAAVRAIGVTVLVAVVAATAFGLGSFEERFGSGPAEWATQKWEAFRTDDITGQEQSRYLSASGSGRYNLWQVGWKDFSSEPILGVGTHNYEASYYRLRDQPTSAYVRQPHMLPLEVVAERGLVGGALFFGFLAVCVVSGLWSRFGRLRPEARAMVGATVAAVAYWFVHSSAEWFWQIPAVTLPAVVYLAMLVAPWRRFRHSETRPSRWPVRAGVAAAAVLVVVAVAPLYASQIYLDESEAEPNPWLALRMVEQSQRYNPADPRLAQREAALRARIGDWPRAIDAYERAIRLNPQHYAPRVLLAGFYERHGEPERALSLYKEASSLNPFDGEVAAREKALEEKVGR